MEKLDPKAIENILALTPLQEGMLFHYIQAPRNALYFEQLSLRISGTIDARIFEKAWNTVSETNEMLRTAFRWEKLEKPSQVILKEFPCEIRFHDLSGMGNDQRKKALAEIKASDRGEGFELTGVPFRVILCRLAEMQYEMIISNHHILYDGWSNGIILREFFNAYHSLCKGEKSLKIPVKPSFKDFIKWIQSQDKNKQEQYWRDYLTGFETPTELPIKKRMEVPTGAEDYSVILEEDTRSRLDVFIKNNKITLASVFYSAWGILLQRYSGSEDVVFGTTVSGRSADIKGIEDMVGLFINTIPLRTQTAPNEKIIDVVFRIDQVLPGREEFENTPLVDIGSYSSVDGVDSVGSLFATIVAIENYPLDNRLVPSGEGNLLTVHSYTIIETTHYDLSVNIIPFNEIEIKFSFKRELFEKEFIENLARHFNGIIHAMIENPGMALSQLEIISIEEKNRVLNDFNNTAAEYPVNKTVHQLFEEQVEKSPDRVGLVGPIGPVNLAYRQLNQQSDRLANWLIEQGVQPDTIVGIMTERSLEMVIGIFGILKAGGAYLPIDPGYPQERIDYMLRDSNAKILLMASDLNSLKGDPRRGFHHSSFIIHRSNQLAYIIYTSGSTGKPKGVMVEHASVVNLLVAMQNRYPFTPADTYLLKTSYTFDVSVTELFGWYMGGGRLAILATNGEKDPLVIFDWIHRHHVTHINFVPSMFNAFLDFVTEKNKDRLSGLKYIFLAGEALLPSQVKKFKDLNTSIPLKNIYGPTEGTVYSSHYSLSDWNGIGNVPIGKPLPNIELHILNKYNHLQPLGIPGELVIGGDGVARGYLNNPDLTADKFTKYRSNGSYRTYINYKSGDFCKWLPDGAIEFLGRIDQQVKIRGFRIEPGEIENRLLKHEQIKDAVVLVKEDTTGDKYLAAYFVSGREIPGLELREYLAKDLPDYMIPSYYTRLEKMPLTPGGKLERTALPEPELKAGDAYEAPRNEMETKLVEIWAGILGKDITQNRIGIADNFFRLGGHSLKATSLASRIYKEFNVKIPLGEIFKRPTIRGLFDYIHEAVGEKYAVIEPVEKKEYYLLSSAQKRLYFLQQMDSGGTAYNISAAWVVEGVIDKLLFEQAMAKLIRRHESLRTSFAILGEEPVQIIHDEVELEIEYLATDEHGQTRTFDLSKAPLMRIGLAKLEDGRHVLMVDMHHIISDGVSTQVLAQDFSSLYAGKELPGIKLQYKDYSEWQKRASESKKYLAQCEYWKKEYEGEIPLLELPTDYARPPIRSFEGNSINFEINRETFGALKALWLETGATLYIVLLTLYTMLLAKLSSREDIVVGTPVAGRRHTDLEKIIGMFVNTLALRSYPSGDKRFMDILGEVKDIALKGFENQEYQYEDLVDRVVTNRDVSRNPLFDTMLAVQNTGSHGIEIPGLKLTPYEYENKTAKFDLILTAVELEDQLQLSFEYSTKLFRTETILRFIGYFKNMVDEVIKNREGRISDFEIITAEEKQRIIFDFNKTEAEYPKDKTIHQLFVEQVGKTPDHIAIVGATAVETLRATSLQTTYHQLNEQTDKLARLLIEKGVLAGNIVAIMMERSVEMVIRIMGILKSGGAYLPIDPQYPQERIDYMLRDSGTKLLAVANYQEGEKVRRWEGDKVRLEEIPKSSYPLTVLPSYLLNSSNLAYVIYTSGTTGKPKSAGVYHRGFFNLIHWFVAAFGLTSEDRNILLTSLSFDLTQKNIFAPLVTGGQLVLSRSDYFDPAVILQTVERKCLTWLNCTPSMAYKLIEYSGQEELKKFASLRSLRYMFLGGEPISMKGLGPWVESTYFNARIVNTYGPTECTDICASYSLEEPGRFHEENVPTGKPIYNVKLYILDRWRQFVPIGVTGELFIGGEGIGLGYINHPELTAERFLKNHRAYESSRTYINYKTGDLCKWLVDGNIQYLGRIDHQVKIRGYRIELGEIENQLLKHKKIKEAVIVAKEDIGGEKYLTAYFVAHFEVSGTELKEYLLKTLPDYMIPSYFIQIEKIPLTAHGKVDHKALPQPELKTVERYTAPRNEIEKKLVALWSEILGRDDLHASQLQARLGIDDNFFELGGHSLRATILAAKIHKAFQVSVPLAKIFTTPTIRDLANFIRLSAKDKFVSLEPVEKKAYYALSSGQKRLYVLQQMDEQGVGYNIPAFLVFEGDIDKEKLKQTFKMLIARHESLRTSFHMINEEPVQKIHDEVEFEIEYFDLAAKNAKDREGEKLHHSSFIGTPNHFIRAFDLSNAPLLRVGLLKEKESRHILMLDMHHIISDGTSMAIVVNDFMVLYRRENLPELQVQYKDFSEWQNSQKQKEVMKRQGESWINEFAGEIPVLELPTDYTRPSIQRFEGSSIPFEIAKETVEVLKKLTLETNATMYMILLTIYTVFLAKMTGQEDIVVGSPIAGRRHGDLEKIIGMFVNTLPMRNYPSGEKTFGDFMEELKENTLKAFENQEYQYEDLVDRVVINRDVSRNPLFDTMLAVQNTDSQEIEIPGLKLTPHEYENKTAKFDLVLNVIELEDQLQFTFEYSTKLFRAETIDRFIGYFKNIVNEVIKNRERRISDFEIITAEEKQRVLFDFNETRVDYPKDKTIQQLLEEQTSRTPDHIAIVGTTTVETLRATSLHTTYRQLNDQSDKVAGLLIEKGVLPDNIVGIMIERSIELVIGIWGIVKSGSAYLPIDPGYPQDRIDYMLKDSGAKLLVTPNDQEGDRLSVGKWEGEKILLEEIPKSSYPLPFSPSYLQNSSNLAYVIYTSGSTGKPKGAIVKMEGFLNLVRWHTDEFKISANDNVLLIAPISFDLAQKNLFSSFIVGGCLTLAPPGVPDYHELSEIIRDKQITLINCAPSVFYPLLELNCDNDFVNLKSLRKIIMGGEPIQVDKLLPWVNSGAYNCELVNTYGPTECTDISSSYRISNEAIRGQMRIPIGKPIYNVKIFIVDKYLNILPVMVSGEVCIGEIGVSLGYCNNPLLTQEKFRELPHLPGKIIYRSGDIGRWLADGNIEFVGRIDHQVKVRGVRIELGEIERQLLGNKEIKDAVVISREREKGDNYLCAYIVPHTNLSISKIREYLAQRLPEYMIPTYFVWLEQMPLTPSGKVDRMSLPLPGPGDEELNSFVAPRNEIERKLAEIWTGILGRNLSPDRIGIDDNFFRLGGHSLKATFLGSLIYKTLNVKIPLGEIFKRPTIRGLFNYINEAVGEKYLSIEPVEKKEYYILSSAQKRLYFLQQMDSSGITYNISAAWVLEGIIDKSRLEKSITKLIRRHESLRTSFAIFGEEPVQRIHDEVEFEIEYLATDEHGQTRTFDLSKAPLMRIGLAKLEDGRHVLMVDMHHIISDGVSTQVLAQDFSTLYAGKELPGIKLQYKDYSEWQKREKESKKLLAQCEYWKKEYEGEIPLLELPTDYARPPIQSSEGNSINFEINNETFGALKTLWLESEATLYIILLTLYTILLAKLSSREDIVVGTPVAGRRHTDLEKIIGMFVNTLALRNYPSGGKRFRDFLGEVKEIALKGFENQDYQYEDLVEQVVTNRDVSRSPLFDTMLAVQNTGSQGIEIPGLKLTPYEYENKTVKFDLILTAVELEDQLQLSFEYCTRLFRADTILRFVGYFKNMVNEVIKNKEGRISDFEIITAEEKQQVLFDFNKTEAEYPKDKTVHQLFTEQAEKSPDRSAVFGQGRTRTNTDNNVIITYRQLNEQSNRLAGLLIEKGVLADNIVGIMAERSVEMVIGIMGILKSGGAYLPIDPQYPQERIDYMLKDSGTQLLVNEKFFRGLSRGAVFQKSPPCNVNLAYIIYTSGSTGRPKGVMIDHKSFTDFTTWAVVEFEHRVGYRVLLSNSFASDGSIQQIFPPLISGGVLHIITKELRLDVARYLDYLKVHRINNIDEVPVLMKELVSLIDPADPEEKLPDLTCLSLGSEYVPIDLIRKCRQHLNHHGRIINAYGPAEASVETTTYHCDGTLDNEQSLIGKPRRNIRVYILDESGHCCPIGVRGEICVGGVGLARGYLNQPELTAERFKFNRSYEPYILYKTGDMGRWLPDGNIEFIGRIDNQVKIRGFRVELAEIENRLISLTGVKEVVVLEVEEAQADKYLCAYFVSDRELEISEFQEYLAKELPDYMIPAFYMRLEKIPLTPNGKIDRIALPKPQLKIGENYIAPRDDTEKTLGKIWSEILGKNDQHASIGIDNNFFLLGGHSLKATIMMSKIHKELNVKVELMDIFRTPTIREIARLIRGLKKEVFQAIEPVEKKEYYALSSAQKRLYFLQQMDLNSTSYNMPMVLSLGKGIKEDKLKLAFKQLIHRHESLRTSIERVNDDVVQRIHESVEFEIEYFDLAAKDAKRREEKQIHHSSFMSTQNHFIHDFIRPFDLSKAPLMRSGLILLPDGNNVWLVDVHHIVSDGTSHTILTEDFMHLYDTGVPLEPLPIQYKDFAQWQNQLFASGRIKDQEDYWMQLYAGEIPRLNLATDYKRPVVFTFKGDYHMLKLEREDIVRFKALGARHGGTLYMNIMAALNTLFYKYTGQTDIILGSGIAGRQHADIQGVVGMFVNTLAMRNYPDGQKPYEYFLAEVIANSIRGFENQDVQFEELVDKLDPVRDPSRNPLFDILMVVQNFREIDSTISLEQLIALDESSPVFEYKNPTSKFDLTFFVHEQGDDVYIDIEYYTDIFTLDTLRRLDSHFKHVVKTVIAEPAIKLREIEIISKEEKQQVLFEFNDTIRDYPREKSIPVFFQEQVEQIPDHIALVGAGLRVYPSYLTYRELNEQSNRLANYLYYGNRVAVDQPVGIMMDRSLEMITAVLGILKAGGAYTPISPSYPLERIKKMINDAGIKILLSQKRCIKNLNRLQWECGANLETFFCIDSCDVYGEEEVEENQLMSRKLWEYVGETAVDEVTGGGWNSSYTGEPIPKEEMDEYGDNVLRKLEPLLHKQMRMLEIGAASGISMYRIAPRVGLYYGTDLSGVIIEKNKRRIMEEGHKNIKLLRAAAHEIDLLNELGEKDFDLVIVNSVIQCFHGHNYLRNVIRKAINLMGTRGYLFIGDIMDQDLKENLIADMVRFKHANSGMGYKTKTDWSEELFISRSFLEDLTCDYPEIYDMEFSGKIHTMENELTRFRYDALIKIDRSGKESKKIKSSRRHKTGHDWRELGNFRADKLGLGLGGGNLAYIIYTSGSTGIPKGVMVDHRNVVRLVKNTNFVELRAGDRILQTGALEFDASTLEIWGALLNGLVLVLESKENLLEAGILKAITAKHKISVMWMTSSFFNQILDEDVEVFKGLRYLLVGGEALSSSHINRLRSRYPGHNVINGYGPTENTTFSTTFLIDKEYTENIPIGRPIANSMAYVLDRDCNLLPPGVAGELYVGGEGVARGYLNSPEPTFEKFNRSYRTNKTYICYKTGDLARWLSSGVIEFLGRIDNQVKIRGYRIEMQEIENRLLKVEQVKEAVVIDRVDASRSKYLCAYVVIEEKSLLADLRDLLSKDFPDYMIPTYFIPMKTIPLTPNGKADRRALPGPEAAYIDENAHDAHKAPRNQIENKLVDIWHDVLSLPHHGIGIEDNFFQLGGHSLKATILVSKIHKEFDVKVPLAEIFKTPSIMGLAEFIKRAEESRFFSISRVEKKEYYALSSAQKRIYILQQMNKDGITYNMPSILLLEGVLDRDKFENTFDRLIQRHESLRTSFHMVNDAPVQKINDTVEFEIENYELTAKEREEFHHSSFIGTPNHFIRAFELSNAPLLHVGLVKEKEDRHILMVDMPHIISDGTSMNILVRDFMALYQGEGLAELRVQYKDFSGWQNNEKQKESIKRQEDFWIKEFEGEIPVLALPLDYARPSIQSFEGGSIHFEIDKETSGLLKKFTLEKDTTMYMALLALYTMFLSKVTGQEDIVVGTPIAGRRHADLEKIIGMFVNTLVLRNYSSAEKKFSDFLEEVKEKTLKAFENQDYQYEDLVEKVAVIRDISRNPLFDSMLALRNTDSQEVKIPGLKLTPYEYKNNTAKFDLILTAIEAENQLHLTFEYCTKLFRAETIDRFIAYFKNIVNDVIKNKDRRISDFEIITEEEKKKVLFDFNNTTTAYPADKTIHQLFVEQVGKTPDHIAIVGAGSQTCPITLSYNKLNEQSDRLAGVLIEQGVLPDNIVGIMVERSVEMIIGILGILKSGGAYLPIDPEYPQERIDYILKDSNAKVLLGMEEYRNKITVNCQLLIVNCKLKNMPQAPFHHSAFILNGRPDRGLHHSNQLAYIIYTSGSTGKPKGVMVGHRNVVNLVNGLNRKIYKKYDTNLNVCLVSPFVFDASVKQVFAGLLLGHSLYVAPEGTRMFGELLRRYYIMNKIDISDGTPIHLRLLLESACEATTSIPVRNFIIGGDVLPGRTVEEFLNRFGRGITITNIYGPTECTVDTTCYDITRENTRLSESIPIGCPMPNCRVYILDKWNRLQAVSIPGELCIGGQGISRGYLNRPDSTFEKFKIINFELKIKNGNLHHSILYRTGDLARWLPDGNIEFLGRMDNQVKIRGYRIELGEIENHLRKVSGVKEAVVLAFNEDSGNNYLCAYIVSESEFRISELRLSLVKELPDYMIPSYFVQMDKIPLTPSGKVDRRALPGPKEKSLREDADYTLPSSEVEKKLVEIWEKVLGRNNISINENFFTMGGDSIKSIQIISRMRNEGYKIEMKDLFQYPVIANLAPRVKKIERILDQSVITGTIPLTPIQEKFFSRSLNYPHHYNQAVMLFFKEELQEECVRVIFSKIQEHHDALRMSYIINEGHIIQTNHGLGYPLSLQEYDLRAHENAAAVIEKNADSIQANIHLEKGPMMKLGLFHCRDGDYFLIVIHHLVIDGISWRILFEDIDTLYQQYKNSVPLALPPKTDSFKSWAEKQNEYAQNSLFLKEKDYWGALEQTPTPSIATDFAADNICKDVGSLSFSLNEEATSMLLGKVNEALGTEINDILLTALGLSISSIFGISQVLVALEGHGREKIVKDIDITRTIGWFTTVYPVILDMSHKNDLSRQIKEVKEHLHQLPHRGIGYGILKYLTNQEYKEEIEFRLKPRICFNYLGQFDTDIKQSTFTIANQPLGNFQDPRGKKEYQLDISGQVSDRCLTMTIGYNRAQYKKESIEKLSGQFKRELIRIISHCTSRDKKQLTPSDFAYKNLSFKDLNEINKLFNKN